MLDRDAHYMNAALELAKRGLGQTWPNPSVGCVIVDLSDEAFPVVVGRGTTSQGGRPHAEVNALEMAGPSASGSTVYVSLEPCAHEGETGPCAKTLVDAGVARVVCALQDPNPKVSGKGFDLLRDAGIQVVTGVGAEKARDVTLGFLRRVERGRPLITAKVATSLDGKIATKTGKSKWITGPGARERGHLERAQSDAIMIGSTTAIMDDPTLTCRLPGLENRSPIRIVLDGRLRLPLTSNLVRGAKEVPLWLVTLHDADEQRLAAFKECGVEVIQIDGGSDHLIDISKTLDALGERGLTRVLVEGGASLHASLFKHSLVDRILWFRAGKVIGGDGIPGVHSMGIEGLEDVPQFSRVDIELLGEDCLETFKAVEL